MNIKEYFFVMILLCVCGILDGQVCFLNLFFFQISDTLFLFYSIKFIYFFKQLFIPVWIETIVSDHFKVFIRTVKDKIVYKVFSTFIYFDIFFILMTVVPSSDHLFVIFIFDDAVFSHGRSGSVSGNVIDAIINIIVIIVFFFLFSVDIKAVYKFIIESLFKITKMFELLFRKKIKDLIHPSLSELFIGNKSSSFYFFWYQKLLHKQGSGYGDSISNLCQKYVKSKQNRKWSCFCHFYRSRSIWIF